MANAAVADIPWAAAISGAVGIAGIAGSVLTAHITNRAAERRLHAEHKQADRTRFHHLRVELYGKLFTAIQGFRETFAKAFAQSHDLSESQVAEFIDSFTDDLVRIKSSAQMVGLVASGATRQTTAVLVEAALALPMHGLKSKADFQALNRELDKAETAFSEAARTELLPPDECQRLA